MTDITNPILSAILAALDAHIEAKIRAALAPLDNSIAFIRDDVAHVKQGISTGGIDTEALRELVAPIVKSQIEAAIETAMIEHTDTYNHDDYDDCSSKVGDYDFDDFVTRDDLANAVRDEVGDLTFEVRVS